MNSIDIQNSVSYEPMHQKEKSISKRKLILLSLLVFSIFVVISMRVSNSKQHENAIETNIQALVVKENERVGAFIPDSFDIRYTAEGKKCDWAAREEYSCVAGNWAFTLTQTFRNTKCYQGSDPGELSAQQLIDCTANGSNTCGDFVSLTNLTNAFSFLQTYGVGLAATYPYKTLAASPGDCSLPSVDFESTATLVTNTTDLMTSIINNGPAFLVLNYYSSFTRNNLVNSIYAHTNPDFPLGYRTVMIVGWGTDSDSGKQYWIVGNTYGQLWGNNGYSNIFQDDSYINAYYTMN